MDPLFFPTLELRFLYSRVQGVFTINGPNEGFIMGELSELEQERLASMAIAYGYVQRRTGQKDILLERGYLNIHEVDDAELRSAMIKYQEEKRA